VILFKVMTKKFVNDSSSQFQNFHVNFHKFHKIITVSLGYHMFWRAMLAGAYAAGRATQARQIKDQEPGKV
jgi:hypothetical protein